MITGYPGELTPLPRASVTLYAAGTGTPSRLGRTTTDDKGSFTLSYRPPRGNAVLYAVADAEERAGVRLMSVAGSSSHPQAAITLNELSTVASAEALNQFLTGSEVRGSNPGLANAAATVANLVDLTAGRYSAVVANSPNGYATDTLATLGMLSNLLTTCTRGKDSDCGALYDAATPPGGTRPVDTLDAIHAIARNPTNNVSRLFDLAGASSAYTPALKQAPDGWSLSLNYTAPGIDSIGSFAFDADGNAWMANNMQFPGSDPGRVLPVLGPAGVPLKGSPFEGGGLNLPGFGIAVAPDGSIWVANVGDQGSGKSLSKFTPGGKPLSPASGFTQGNLQGPQGLTADKHGNIWAPNWAAHSITEYPKGHPAAARNITAGGIDRPFAIATDQQGRVWINNFGSVTVLTPDGEPTLQSPITGGGMAGGKGIAIDSLGNAWTSNFDTGSITEITKSGTVDPKSPLRATSLHHPWGIAVDGNDNIWVADADNQNVTELCGARPETCPRTSDGKPLQTGDPISPTASGWTNKALHVLTGVAIDPSGNVWTANNYNLNADAPRPVTEPMGATYATVFIGMAAPVKTPLNGPPQQP